MNRTIILVIWTAATLLIYGCPDIVEDPDPPAAPVLVPKSLPEAWVERGIDADNSGVNRIVLMWYPNQEEDLSGYRIYRADSMATHTFSPIGTVDLFQAVGVDTAYFDDSLNTYVDYFYYITATDNAENESNPSDTVSYALMLPPIPEAPVNTIIDIPQPTFSWTDRLENYTYTQEYVLRLDRVETTIQTIWIARFTQQWYENQTNSTPIEYDWFPAEDVWPDNVISCQSTVGGDSLPEGQYRWKIKNISEIDNATGLDESGAESEWAFFFVDYNN